MSQYAAEPAPASLDPTLAEFLARQLVAIQNALTNNGIVLEVSEVPTRPVPGAMVNVNNQTAPADNGFYVCAYNSQGEGEWKKIETS